MFTTVHFAVSALGPYCDCLTMLREWLCLGLNLMTTALNKWKKLRLLLWFANEQRYSSGLFSVSAALLMRFRVRCCPFQNPSSACIIVDVASVAAALSERRALQWCLGDASCKRGQWRWWQSSLTFPWCHYEEENPHSASLLLRMCDPGMKKTISQVKLFISFWCFLYQNVAEFCSA